MFLDIIRNFFGSLRWAFFMHAYQRLFIRAGIAMQTITLIQESTMSYAIAGDAVVARPFHPINSIQFHHSNNLSGASFTPPPRKSWLQRLWEILSIEGRP